MMASSAGSLEQIVARLRENIHHLEGGRRGRRGPPSSSGCPPLDRLLPEAGFPRGAVIEWLSAGEGSGAAMLALIAAREAIASGGALVVLDRRHGFYPPAAAALGIDLGRTIVLRAARAGDELWALDQVLRCRGVGAVYAALERLEGRWFRRLQLAVEEGGGLGLLVRPAEVRGQPSWSQVQLLVQPRPSQGSRRLRIEVTRCHGSAPGGVVELAVDDVTGSVQAWPAQEGGSCRGEPRFLAPTSPVARCRSSSGRHETRALYLASQLASPAARRFAARA